MDLVALLILRNDFLNSLLYPPSHAHHLSVPVRSLMLGTENLNQMLFKYQ